MSEWWDPFGWFDDDDPMFSKIDHLDGSHSSDPARNYDGIWDFNDVEEFNRVRQNDPFTVLFDPLLDWWQQKKVSEDNERWYEDYYKNTGQTWKNSQYPWKSYYQNGPGSYNSGSSVGSAAFAVNKSIMNLYNVPRWKRW